MPVSDKNESMEITRNNPGFAVYVHWPFCTAKCPYCDFNSHVRHGGIDEADFVAAYLREISYFGNRLPNRKIDSIFFGGGTPSLMAPASVAAILDHISTIWSVDEGAEITLEANPASVDAARFTGYRTAGVNRLSIGVQSLLDDQLVKLGRLHTADEALSALDVAQKNFDRVSIDLIYARPNQTLEDWRKELARALDLGTGHLSLYQLTIEGGTPYGDLAARGRLKIPESELAVDFFDLTQDLCTDAGLPAYEISNHARPGEEGRHNLVYWRYGEYVGIGPGAHGRLGPEENRRATVIESIPETWRDLVRDNGHGVIEEETLSREEAGEEYVLMGLRLVEGIDERRYRSITGKSLDGPRRDSLVVEGFLKIPNPGFLQVTKKGRTVLNRVIAELLS